MDARRRRFEFIITVGTVIALAALRINSAAADTSSYSYGLLPAQSSGSAMNDDSELTAVSAE